MVQSAIVVLVSVLAVLLVDSSSARSLSSSGSTVPLSIQDLVGCSDWSSTVAVWIRGSVGCSGRGLVVESVRTQVDQNQKKKKKKSYAWNLFPRAKAHKS